MKCSVFTLGTIQVTDTICKQVPSAICRDVKKQKCENVPVVTCRCGSVTSMRLALVLMSNSTGISQSLSVKLCPTKSASWYCFIIRLFHQIFFPDQVKDSVCNKIPHETCSAATKKQCQNFSVVTCRYRIC